MAEFECDGCGKCCGSLGPLITIERQLNDRDYYCRNGLNNELFMVRVEPDYEEEISEEFPDIVGKEGVACRKTCVFLRKNVGGSGFACSVYPTRPKVCRDFRCYHMVIYKREGHSCGRVVGRHDIQTTDETLTRIWDEEVAAVSQAHTDGARDPAWIQKVLALLSTHGYRGDPVEWV
jgi:hypothetical protein